MAKHKLPPASAYSGSTAEADRFQDYQRINEGLPPLLGAAITEAQPAPPAPVPDLPPLHELRTSDPDAFNELRRAYANSVFAGHDSRRDGGHSPFNRGVGD